MNDDERDEIAARLYDALESNQPIDRLTATHALEIEDAYRVQDRFIDRRLDDDNEIVGHKIGLTSEGIQEQLNVNEPDFGRLLTDMFVTDHAIPSADLINPRIEPEIGFLLERSLEPPVTYLDVLDATKSVFPVLEIIDSRIADWDIRIQDTIADNASAGSFVTGEAVYDPMDRDLSFEGVKLWKNGQLDARGIGANVLDHPARAVAWLANTLDNMGDSLEAGEIILSGSFTPATDISSGDVLTAEFSTIGSITVHVD